MGATSRAQGSSTSAPGAPQDGSLLHLPPPPRCRRLTLKPEPKVSPRFSVVNLKPPIIPAGQGRIFAELYQLTDRFANWLRGDGVEDSLQVSSCCLRAICTMREQDVAGP